MTSESRTDSCVHDTEGPSVADFWFVWFFAWLGITAAGGVFGLIAGSIEGLLAGPFIAASFAVPVIITFAVLTWALWLTRFTVVTAAGAGACTGVMATALTWASDFETEFAASLVLAGGIGAVGSGLITSLYLRKQAQSTRDKGTIATEVKWRFSLRDLFLRFTIVTSLIAGWTFVITQYLDF